MRVVQGAGAFSTGAYIDVRDREKRTCDAEIRRIFTVVLSTVVAVDLNVIIRQITPPSNRFAVAVAERDQYFDFAFK